MVRLLSSCLVLSRLASSCLLSSRLVLSCLVSSCFVLSPLLSSCLVLFCLVSSCFVLSPLLSSSLSRPVLSLLVVSCLDLSRLSCLLVFVAEQGMAVRQVQLNLTLLSLSITVFEFVLSRLKLGEYFGIAVSVSVCPCVWALSSKYHANRSAFCNQTCLVLCCLVCQ